MKQKVVAQESDLKAHLAADPMTAHAIADKLKKYIRRYVQLADVVSLTGAVTMDASWRTLDLTSYVSALAVRVHLAFDAGGGTAGAYEYILTRIGGTSTTFATRQRLYVKDSTAADAKLQQFAVDFEQELSSTKTIDYNIQKTNTCNLYIVGYWETLA